jgi:hypothetical protein
MWLGVAAGVAIGVTAAFVLPATAAGWFTLTASDAAIALASGAGQGAAGLGLTKLLEFSGGELEPGALTPEAQELPLWKQVAGLYRTAGRQVETIRNLHKIVTGAEFLTGEIRVQVAGGVPTMTEDQALDRVATLLRADQAMADKDDAALSQGLTELRAFEQQVNALAPDSLTFELEQEIWILWMAELTDSSVLDLDEIENRLHKIGVLGKGSRLGVDFGSYTFFWDEMFAHSAAKAEAANIREKVRAMQPATPDAGK